MHIFLLTYMYADALHVSHLRFAESAYDLSLTSNTYYSETGLGVGFL